MAFKYSISPNSNCLLLVLIDLLTCVVVLNGMHIPPNVEFDIKVYHLPVTRFTYCIRGRLRWIQANVNNVLFSSQKENQ